MTGAGVSDNVAANARKTKVLTAAISIGGTARRLDGRVKGARTVGGSSILTRQLDAATGIEHIVLVGRWTARRSTTGPCVREPQSGEMRSFDANGTMLMNLNTPLDYERACRLAAGDGA